MKRYAVLLGSVFLLLSLSQEGLAATKDQLRQIQQKMEEEQQQMEEKQRQRDALDAAATRASKSLDELRSKLITSAQSLQDKATEEDNLEDKLDDLTEQIATKSQSAKEEQARLSLLVSALIEVAARPPETLFLQKGTAEDHIHRSLLFHAVLPGLRDEAATTAQDLATLYDLKNQLAEQKRLVAASQMNLQQQQHDLDQLIAARQGFLQRTEKQKSDIADHLEALSSEAKDLRQLMERVSAPQPRRAPKSIPGDTVALRWPVSGVVQRHFGEQDNDGVTSEGLTLTGPSGAPIVAPRAGRVVFVGPFRGYGQIMILQHANGYHSFLAGFGRIDAEMGEDVVAGEPLGVLPIKAGTKPQLYFEWRHNDEPVDPTNGLNVQHS